MTRDKKKHYQIINKAQNKRNKDELLRYDVYKNVKNKFYYIILSNNTANKFSTTTTVLNSFDDRIWTISRFELMNDCICIGSLNSEEIEKLQQRIDNYFKKDSCKSDKLIRCN